MIRDGEDLGARLPPPYVMGSCGAFVSQIPLFSWLIL